MKKNMLLVIAGVLVLLMGTGCSSLLTSMLGGAESPRPKEYQVIASEEIVTGSVEEVMKGQLGKQSDIKEVAKYALIVLGGGTIEYKQTDAAKDMTKGEPDDVKEIGTLGERREVPPNVTDAVTNVVANTVKAILHADGSAELLSKLAGNTNKSLLEMSAVEYLGYVGGQTAVAMRNQEALYSGITSGVQWTAGNIAKAGGLTSLATAFLVFGITTYRKMRSKDKLLKSTGKVIKDFAKGSPQPGEELKINLAKAASGMTIDAVKEFGI